MQFYRSFRITNFPKDVEELIGSLDIFLLASDINK